MHIYKYKIKMRHDSGTINITTWARNRDVAIELVCAAERAPKRSVLSVYRYKRS